MSTHEFDLKCTISIVYFIIRLRHCESYLFECLSSYFALHLNALLTFAYLHFFREACAMMTFRFEWFINIFTM